MPFPRASGTVPTQPTLPVLIFSTDVIPPLFRLKSSIKHKRKVISISYTADTEKIERELNGIFRLFFDTEPLSFQIVNTSHGKEDFRYDYKRESNISAPRLMPWG